MTDAAQGHSLSNLLQEERRFPPSSAFTQQANASSVMYDEAAADRLAFWEEQARRLRWETPWTQALDWSDAPFAKWFVGG
ncbi:MAG TPA: acetyl-coenzyme A synthetase N-terminal domain-containing protein, partial [Actinomycetes bacterium]|nr:acetyl-coenzyme A synthetase N-terminal domain-containing protein [Actinomycetes bacterium]